MSAGNIALFYWGLRTTTASATAIIYATVPLIVALAAPKLIGEIITRNKLIGIILGLAGAVFIAILPIVEHGQQLSGDVGGNLLVFVAALCWSGYTIGSRHMLATKQTTPMTMTSVSIFVSTAVFALFSAFQWKPEYLAALSGINIIIIVQLGVFVTVLTYLLFQWVIKHSSASTASLNQYLQPVFSLTFNMFFLGERLTVGFWIGSVIVFSGVFLATGERLYSDIKSRITKNS